MLPAKDLQSIADACVTISNELGEPSGFIPVRKLLERFDVGWDIRSLLVEGMLVSIPVKPGARAGLAVLLDSETFDEVTLKDLALEAEVRPLPARFRATVAHELLHSLAFRPTHFGVRLSENLK